MRLLAAGLNAHRQLEEDDGNLRTFRLFSTDGNEVLLSTWSTLVIKGLKSISSYGHQPWTHQFDDSVVLHSAIGDHNGFLAALDHEGCLWTLSADDAKPTLEQINSDSGPSLAYLAMCGNGRVAFTFQQAPNGNLAHVGEFASFDAFIAWHSDPTDPERYPIAHHMVPGTPIQLLAGTGTFAMLMENHSLYTWGDARYRSLARSTVEAGAFSAGEPGLVDALAGIKLCKIALGGWVGGAVSADGAAYLWGSSMPGKQTTIDCLGNMNKGDCVALVEVGEDGMEEPDVVDLAIGDGHAVLVTSAGRTFVVGENGSGQLGLGFDDTSFSAWKLVTGIHNARQAVCGPKSTFLFTA